MTRERSLLRNASEYALARSALLATQAMPARLLGPTSRAFGRTLHAVIKSRRRVVRENLELAFGTGDGVPDAISVGRASLSGLCLSFLELAHVPKDRERLKVRTRFRNPERWEALQELRKEGPVIIAGSHFGAYEILGLILSAFEMPTTTLARPLDNPWLERWLTRRRQLFGQRLAANRGGMPELLKALSDRRDVGVLVDLNHPRRRRIFVDYFGTPAATAPTAAILAVRSGRPLVSCVARRDGPLRYELEVGKPFWPDPTADREEDVLRLMQGVTSEIEDRVRAEPELWLWTHRRWKTRPAPESSDGG